MRHNNPVIIYTDNPKSYNQTNLSSYANVEFCSCPKKFCCSMLENNYSGLILDVRKVMRTPCCERNRILSLSAGLPTMRSMEKHDRPVFLDDQENFICDCQSNTCGVVGSSCPVNVRIPVEISTDDDPAMAQSVQGTIHHVFESGCTFHTNADLSGQNFLYLKIFALKNKLPIYVGVCKQQGATHCSCGFKVKFLDIKNNQLNELLTKYVLPFQQDDK